MALQLAVAALLVTGCRDEARSPVSALNASPAYRIEGTVQKGDTSDHSGITIYIGGTQFQAHTDELGQFVIGGVPPGVYRVFAQHSDYEPALLGDISLAAGIADPSKPVRLDTRTLDPKAAGSERVDGALASVAGTALLQGEKSSAGILVRVYDSQGRPTSFRTATDEQGRYQVVRLDPGEYTLTFEHAGFQTQQAQIRLSPGDMRLRESVTLRRPSATDGADMGGRSITGTLNLFDLEGNPIADTSSAVVYIEGTSTATIPTTGGLFAFLGLAPGIYNVSAAAPGFADPPSVMADVREQENAAIALSLRLLEAVTTGPTTSTMVGRILKDDPKDLLLGTAIGIVELGRTIMTGPNGAYRFENVPAGAYTLLAQAEGYFPGAIEQVIVAEGAEVQVTDLTLVKRRNYPRVLATAPANGARDVLIREIIPMTIRFSKPMRPDTLRAALRIEPVVAHRIFVGREHPLSSDDVMYVELLGLGGRDALHFNTNYTVTIAQQAGDFEGLTLEQPYRFSFRTGRASITGTFPVNGAENVFVDIALYRPLIMFNAVLDLRSVGPETVRIRPAPRSAPQVSVVDNPQNGWSQIQVGANWEPGVRYTVTVNRGVRTRDGSAISNLPYTFTFETDRGREIRGTPRSIMRGR